MGYLRRTRETINRSGSKTCEYHHTTSMCCEKNQLQTDIHGWMKEWDKMWVSERGRERMKYSNGNTGYIPRFNRSAFAEEEKESAFLF